MSYDGEIRVCCLCNGKKKCYDVESIEVVGGVSKIELKQDKPVTCIACDGAGRVAYDSKKESWEPYLGEFVEMKSKIDIGLEFKDLRELKLFLEEAELVYRQCNDVDEAERADIFFRVVEQTNRQLNEYESEIPKGDI